MTAVGKTECSASSLACGEVGSTAEQCGEGGVGRNVEEGLLARGPRGNPRIHRAIEMEGRRRSPV